MKDWKAFHLIISWITVVFKIVVSICILNTFQICSLSIITRRKQYVIKWYRNWPRYGLRWSSWYCTARVVPAGTTSAVPDYSTNHDSADRINGQFIFYHDHIFTKSNENLRFRLLVPLFVPIGVCVTTHDDGAASDVTIGSWRHNKHATNHERNGKAWFSLLK